MKSRDLRDWYRQVPYQSLPFACTHPDRLFVQAMLAGLTPPDPATARVLEIGCASGGNLLPMCETLPDAQLTGIDLSDVQIEQASDLARRASIENVKLVCGDLAEFSDPGPFDYIIAHGVYSWVSDRARQKLLEICGSRLSTNGVACISYNTYPGWHVRGMLRDVMLQAIDNAGEKITPSQIAATARQAAEMFAQTCKLADLAWGSLVQIAAGLLRQRTDEQLLHDDLEPVNHPIYFRDFIQQLSQHRMMYLCPADAAQEPGDRLPPSVQPRLANFFGGALEKEQHLDLILNRAHRESIVCRHDVNIHARPSEEVIASLWIASNLQPVGDQRFRYSGGVLKINATQTARVLEKLHQAWPDSVRYESLTIRPGDKATSDLLALYSNGLIELRARTLRVAGQGVQVSLLASLQAAAGGPVTNLRHQALQFDQETLDAIAGNSGHLNQDQIGLLTHNSLMLR